jgi:hypothetical protein
MKIAWLVLIVSALTDGTLAAVTGIATLLTTVAVNPSGQVEIHWIIFLAPLLGGVAVALRTVQQALKANPVDSAALKGQAPPVVVPATSTAPTIIKEQAKETP